MKKGISKTARNGSRETSDAVYHQVADLTVLERTETVIGLENEQWLPSAPSRRQDRQLDFRRIKFRDTFWRVHFH